MSTFDFTIINQQIISLAPDAIRFSDERGKIIGMASIMRDGTERWQRKKELKQQLAVLRKG